MAFILNCCVVRSDSKTSVAAVPLEGEKPVLIQHKATSPQTDITLVPQLPWDQLLLEIQNFYSTTSTLSHNDLPASLALSLNDMNNRASLINVSAKKLHDFSAEKKKEKLVRIVEEIVPDGILPKHLTAKLYDVKIGGHGPDDKIYNKHEDLRRLIPRGTTIMSIDGINSEDNLDVLIYANRKFTGNIGDEDETQPESNDVWRSYCLDNPDNADNVVVMDKKNGEAAHFSGRYIDGKFYIGTGSKNVHMLISCEVDIDKYEGDRYMHAKGIAKAVWKRLTQMPEKNRQILFSLLHHTKCTVVCEILLPHNQHIVNLSKLKEPSLYVLSMTPTISENDETSLIALPPHHWLDLISALGFMTAPYRIMERNNLDKFIQGARNEMYTEGHVLYYLKNSSGYENTIGLAKTKTVWYVVLRALREKAVYCFTQAKKRDGWSLEDRISSTHKRFNEIQRWLKFSDTLLADLKKLSEEFLNWLNGEINNNSETAENIRPHFPIIWDRFLENTGNQLNIVK